MKAVLAVAGCLKIPVLAPGGLAPPEVVCFAELKARQNKQHQRKGVACKQAACGEDNF
jgi:hypothetical protein